MTEIDDEPATVNLTVTCHTAECTNADIAIDITTVDGAWVVCGVCGQEINDVREATP